MADEQPATGSGQQQDSKQQFAIRKVYLRDVSFEAPAAPAVFTEEWKPEMSVDLDTRATRIGEDTYESILRITVTAKLGDKTAYLCEVEQAGIFIIGGFEDKTRDALLGAYCPAQLFPFAREAVSDVVARGGFPQMLLAPVNFDALYAQQQRKRQQAEQDGDATAAEAGSSDANSSQ